MPRFPEQVDSERQRVAHKEPRGRNREVLWDGTKVSVSVRDSIKHQRGTAVMAPLVES